MGTGRLPIAQLSRDGKRKKGAQPPPSQPNPAIINSPSPLLSATHRITTLRNLQNHLNDHIYAIPHSHLQTPLSVISTHRFPFDTPPSPTTNHQPPTTNHHNGRNPHLRVQRHHELRRLLWRY
ncbi:hypothetical protein FSOLCH5_014919 [Fusarium solani]